MTSKSVFSRTGVAWRHTFLHSSKMLHHLMRALLYSVASAGVVLACICCWLDDFRSGSTQWIIPGKALAQPNPDIIEPQSNALFPQIEQPRIAKKHRPQLCTIDSLIRNKNVRM